MYLMQFTSRKSRSKSDKSIDEQAKNDILESKLPLFILVPPPLQCFNLILRFFFFYLPLRYQGRKNEIKSMEILVRIAGLR